MSLSTENVADTVVIHLEGDFDAAAVTETRPDLEDLLNGGARKVVFNLEKLKFVDSTGIGLIVYAYKRLNAEGGQLRIAGASGQPAELISLLKVEQIIQSFKTVSEACS